MIRINYDTARNANPLESWLAEKVSAEGSTDILTAFCALKRSMTVFWNSPTTQYRWMQRKDVSHVQRVISNIEHLILTKPFNAGSVPDSPDALEAIYPELDWYDVVVLLCSAYLHDYAKGQFNLALPHVPPNERDTLAKAASVSDLPPEAYETIERLHTFALFEFLKCLTCNHRHEDAAAALERLFPAGSVIHSFIGQIGIHNPDLSAEVRSTGDAQKLLFRCLWVLRHSFRPSCKRSLLIEIQIISCLHKQYTIDNEEREYWDCIWQEFPSEPPEDRRRLALLAALLRLSDNLDLTKERIDEKSELAVFLREAVNAGVASGQIPPTKEALFARWIRYLMVEEALIVHNQIREATPFRSIEIEVVLKYKRFKDWQSYLLDVRSAVEKDFMPGKWLGALEREGDDSSPRVRVRLSFEVVTRGELKKLEDEFGVGVVGRFFATVRSGERKKSPLGYDYRLISPEETMVPGASLQFSPLSPTLKLPTNRNLLYLLAFLELYGPTPLQEVWDRLGISAGRPPAAASQAEVEEGGLLQMVDAGGRQTFGIRREAKDVSRLLDEFRKHPVLVRQKVAELEHLQCILPFNRRGAETIRTGIAGLEDILTPLKDPTGAVSGFRHSRNILVVGEPGSGKTTLLVQVLHWNHTQEQRHVLLFTLDELGPAVQKACRENFGWEMDFADNVFPPEPGRIEDFFRDLHARIEVEQADLIGIDGLSRLRVTLGDGFTEFISRFFKTLQIKGITGLFSAEEPRDRFETEEYQADGIIHLNKLGNSRTLEIEKLRGQTFIAGAHPFEILDGASREAFNSSGDPPPSFRPFTTGINIYPNEQYYAHGLDKQQDAEHGSSSPTYLPTGISKLDELLGGKRAGGGYRQGDSILLLGSAGAGKSLFGLHFLKAAVESRQRQGLTNGAADPYVLWLSFESTKALFRRSIASFDDSVGYQRALGSTGFIYNFTPVALLSPERTLYYLSRAT